MNITHTKGHGWTIESPVSLTDTAAAAITFIADPEQVLMGEFVEVKDPEGIRIGHVTTARYVERWDGPSYVVVGYELR